MSEVVPHAPAVFFGHGNPMNALGGPYADAWREVGQRLGRPKAILMISAHWMTEGGAVTAMDRPRTIHDFYGFPKPLYDLDYPAPGDRWLADRVIDLLRPAGVADNQEWGLDHGTWSVLLHVYPDADIPVVQLSIDARLSPEGHYAVGRRLRELREEGVMIAGSGDVVHNLRTARFRGGETAEPFDWAIRFNDEVKVAIAEGDHQRLFPGPAMGPDAALAIPTDEHWLPLFYVLGAAHDGEVPHFFTDSIDAGSISMLGVAFNGQG